MCAFCFERIERELVNGERFSFYLIGKLGLQIAEFTFERIDGCQYDGIWLQRATRFHVDEILLRLGVQLVRRLSLMNAFYRSIQFKRVVTVNSKREDLKEKKTYEAASRRATR